MEKQDIIKYLETQLNNKVEELKKELQQQRDLTRALAELEEFAKTLKRTFEEIAKLEIPDTIFNLVSKDGKVWASKIVVTDNSFEIRNGAYILLSWSDNFVPKGVYRFIVLAIPQDVEGDKDGFFKDEYGVSIYLTPGK